MEEIETIIRAVFTERPVPTTFFGPAEALQQDMPQELASRIEGRAWTSLSLLDWRGVGAPPASYRRYVVPKTFAYYVPSLLVGVTNGGQASPPPSQTRSGRQSELSSPSRERPPPSPSIWPTKISSALLRRSGPKGYGIAGNAI
jgi:hypothetical protein